MNAFETGLTYPSAAIRMAVVIFPSFTQETLKRTILWFYSAQKIGILNSNSYVLSSEVSYYYFNDPFKACKNLSEARSTPIHLLQ